ncbi:MAG: CusA/CzcA family heavy metal efflux RND transporter, partial [Flavobacteriia bacterium]|nr:CusA/CzcA family heavy metal efflux RND transporter [Flavobacteriia bacterium]
KTVEATTRMENILLKFPEVEQVVSRIGAAEVPTDPMSMEESDVIIKLKPKSEWVSAQSKDELADKFKEALSEIPGIDYEFTQPIEMRFNELITGVRADLAIKIFGEDLDILYKKALEVEKAIQNVEGAADISVEKTAGLPQMTVKYNRNNIAKYGLNIEDLNKIITMGFAGMPAGTVFEGEKQFDLVVRYDEKHRKDIQNIETASVLLPNGNNLPLSEFAKISYTKGPAKISRDNTKRRIVIGVNVRNRDLESVVKDVQQIINTEIKLPTAYTVSYGGQFENLRTASARLKIAVPIALVLIFVLLYFAFDSVKEALIIYSAIPLSAIGGVLLLYFRDLPFSISAGVGFIALFGIAVLNGIVLIEEFKELKAHGISNINKRILMGTNNRLRPVLLTAAAAALGFLPMAISTSAGAEVQRPLATVVVGGLISATALTLVVLPVLYAMFDRKGKKIKIKNKALPLLVFLLLPFFAMSQTKEISADQAVEIALKNNNMLKASVNRVNQSKQLIGSAFNIDKTQVYYQYDENNLAENGQPLKVFGISQSIQFPTIYGSQRKAEKQKTKLSFQEYNMNERLLKKEVYSAYYSVVYNMNVVTHYQYLDSLYQQFSNAATKRYDVGETNLLEKLMAETKQKEVSLLLSQSLENVNKANTTLQEWLQSDSTYVVSKQTAPLLPLKEWNLLEHPGLLYYETAKQLSQTNFSIEKQQLLPDLQFSVFQGTNNGMNAKNYSGFQAGVSIPLWFGANKSKINAAKTQTMIIENNYENYKIQLESKYKRLFSDLKKHEEAINYYNNKGQQLSRELTLTASKAFKNGEINFLQYVQLLESATTININYLKDLFNYNTTILELNYLTY